MTLFGKGGLFQQNRELLREDEVLSIDHTHFITELPATDSFKFQSSSVFIGATGAGIAFASIFLPDNVTLLDCIVIGNAGTTDATWQFKRFTAGGGIADIMATAFCNTKATTTDSQSLVDNGTFFYNIRVTGLVDGDSLFGIRITYSTRGKHATN